MRLNLKAGISCAATLMAISSACLVFGYALFFMPPTEAASSPATWLCSVAVAITTCLGTILPKQQRT